MKQLNDGTIKLVTPTAQYAKQVMEFKDALMSNHEHFGGCAGLEDCNTYETWCNFQTRMQAQYGDDYVQSSVFLAVKDSDDRLVGICDFKYTLTDFLFKYGGNIGYSVLSSMRRKGYATRMLKLLIQFAYQLGNKQVIITCDEQNTASRKTIEKCGGELINTITDNVGLGNSGIIMRYKIDIPKTFDK